MWLGHGVRRVRPHACECVHQRRVHVRRRARVRDGSDVQRHVMRMQFIDVPERLLQRERAMRDAGFRGVWQRRQRVRDV